MGVHELLVGTDEMKTSHPAQSHRSTSCARLAMQQGMRTLLQDAIEKAFKGVTDIKQAQGDRGEVGGLRMSQRPRVV